MAYLNLPDALRKRGLVVETVPGWETRSNGYDLNAKAAICHWTAGPANSKTRPSLNICVNGRSDLPGPLCNVYLDRNGVAVVVSARSANHAGNGNWRGVVGNSRLFGTEAEAAGAADFTQAQRAAYPKVNAAYCDLGGFGADMIAGHSEYALPAGRKTDINGYTMDQMRAQVAAILAGHPTQEEDDMPLTDDDLNRIADRIWSRTAAQGGPWAIHMLAGTDAKTGVLQALQAAVNGIPKAVVDRPVVGDKPLYKVVQEMAAKQDAANKLLEAVASKDPAAIAGQIPADLARQVADELGKRLAV